MKMKVLFFMTSILLSGCVKENGVYVGGYSGEKFTKINLSGNYEVDFIESETFDVQLDADSATLGNLNIRVKDEELIIEQKKKWRFFNINNNPRVKLKILSPSLEGIVLNGAIDFHADTMCTLGDLRIDSAGASSILIGRVECLNLIISTSGANHIKAGLSVKDSTLVSSSGASNVVLSGVTKCLHTKTIGASSVDISSLVYQKQIETIEGTCEIKY